MSININTRLIGTDVPTIPQKNLSFLNLLFTPKGGGFNFLENRIKIHHYALENIVVHIPPLNPYESQ